MRLPLILAALSLATAAHAADAPPPKPEPTVAELKAQVAQLQTVVQLVQQQRDTALKQAADAAVEAYVAAHPVAPAAAEKESKK